MDKNAYFVIQNRDDGTYLKIIAAQGRGAGLSIEDVMYYLDKKLIDYDLKELNGYLDGNDYSKEFRLNDKRGYPQNEHLKIDVDKYGTRVVGRFYAPTNDGSIMTLEDIIDELKYHDISFGYILKNIIVHTKARLYCTDILLATALKPIHGHDAEIEYFFNTDIVAKPKLNEDGSVDFHQLGNISHVNKGDRLAHLVPADLGTPGKNVFGGAIPAKKVVKKILRHGRNISLSEDKLDMYSDVSGHATLVDGTVFVSDIYEVPNNVDASTGDITYNGNVSIKGNVNTGYTVKAEGDVIVEGIVEGATIIAGGDIILRLGAQGMQRAKLTAGGNIVSKFLEGCELVKANGSITTDAIMHSTVSAKEEIVVKGKRGLISGGHIVSGKGISAKTLGSGMDTQTILEVGIDPDRMERYHSLEKGVEEKTEELEEIKKTFETFQKRVKAGVKMDNEKLKMIQNAKITYANNEKYIEKAKSEMEVILAEIESAKGGSVQVTGTARSGVTIIIARIKHKITDDISYARFVKEGPDIRMLSL